MAPARRDPRLDFFRGLAMAIIFVAHVRGNSWTELIPARFGFSSAAEMFVFCSGYASALAFGSVFVRDGWRMGATRIVRRIWTIYLAHVGLFLALAAASMIASQLFPAGADAARDFGLERLGSDKVIALARIVSLMQVPDLLNILPMYVVLLAFVPLAMAASRINAWVVFAASTSLWLAVQITGLNLSAGDGSGRTWFFDPFAWQLLFFTGFAIGIRWLPTPSLNDPVLLPVCTTAVALSVPVNFWLFTDNVPVLEATRDALVP